jgi:hypothetical protein
LPAGQGLQPRPPNLQAAITAQFLDAEMQVATYSQLQDHPSNTRALLVLPLIVLLSSPQVAHGVHSRKQRICTNWCLFVFAVASATQHPASISVTMHATLLSNSEQQVMHELVRMHVKGTDMHI